MCKDVWVELDSQKFLLAASWDLALNNLNLEVSRIALDTLQKHGLGERGVHEDRLALKFSDALIGGVKLDGLWLLPSLLVKGCEWLGPPSHKTVLSVVLESNTHFTKRCRVESNN